MKKFANINKIYFLLIFWVLWLFFIVGAFSGTNLALIAFIIGFAITCLGVAYITIKPNEKEKITLNKLMGLLNEDNED